MNRFLAVTAISILFLASAAFGDSTASASLPRYDFEVGRQLTYSGGSSFKYTNENDKSGSMDDLTTRQLTVVAKNADGSYRIVMRSATRSVHNRNGRAVSTPEKVPEDVSYSQFDMRPDSQVIADPGGLNSEPPMVLPPLPLSHAELSGTWSRAPRFPGETFVFHCATAGPQWLFKSSSSDGLFQQIYGIAEQQTIHFDANKGVVTSADSQNVQDYGFKGSGTGLMTLQRDEMISPTQAASLGKDCAALIVAQGAYDDKVNSIQDSPPKAQLIASEARANLIAASAKVTNPEIKTQFDQILSGIDSDVQYNQNQAQLIAAVVNKPAPDFSAIDLTGKPHKLSDYRGKVVVLDFWYRGCGWCIRAMPQMKQVAEDFKDKPVIVIGLNTDTDPADAKFVADSLGLNYTTLRIGQAVVKQFNVQGFPSLLIIDPAGIVRHYDMGYSLTLRADLDKKIQSLLNSTAASAHADVQ